MKTNKAKILDQWFTKQSVADMCVSKLHEMGLITEFTNVIEPSAGEGSFVKSLSKYVDGNYIFAYDIDPKHDYVEQQDWLQFDGVFDKGTVVVGNPPYGRKAKLAVDFINHSLDVADTVAFIVPLALSTSWTAQKNVRSDASLVYEMKLPKNSFTFDGKSVDVPSVFQVWRKCSDNLRLTKPQTEHPELEIKIYNKTKNAEKWLDWDWDIAVKRNSKNGEFTTNREEVTNDTHWILIKGDIELLSKIDWSKLNDNKMTAGMGKADVIKAYKEVKSEENRQMD